MLPACYNVNEKVHGEPFQFLFAHKVGTRQEVMSGPLPSRNPQPLGHSRRTRRCRPTEDDKWSDFENHFLLRRVALSECHRLYGTPWVHERACTRCRFLRVDPAQLGGINEMAENAEQRLVEAKDRAWLGEVAALEESINHARIRQSEAQQRLSHCSNPFAEQKRQCGHAAPDSHYRAARP